MSRNSLVFLYTLATAMVAIVSPVLAVDGSRISWKRIHLDDKFRSEGAAVGDFNHDGKLDIAAGSVYYAAPDWKLIPIADKAMEYDPHGYSNSFVNAVADLNSDGWADLMVVDFPSKETWWFENPQHAGGAWKRHVITPVSNNESPAFIDVDGRGKPSWLMAVAPTSETADGPDRRMAILTPAPDPFQPWLIRAISAAGAENTVRYAHGLGAGDINKDGRIDVLVPQGWWERPAVESNQEWTFHPAPFGEPCAHMYVYDFDGDGDNDVVSSAAHQLGIWWHEQTADGWKTHEISREFSQTHSLMMADINGDGLPDLVTGKRWWAHGPNGDVQPDAPAMVFWFELSRQNGKPTWTPHRIDSNSGVGTQFDVADVDGDGLLDVITANKKGVRWFKQVRE